MKIPAISPAEHLFRQFCDSYKKRDLTALMPLFSSTINMWGTGIDEYRVGLKQVEEQLKRDWSQAEKSEMEIVSFIPTTNGELWAAAICNARITIDGQEHVFQHLRGTLIIEKELGTWKIAHMHASFPDYRNPENGSFPVNN